MKTHTIALVCFIAAALAVAAILLTSRSPNSAAPAAGVGQPVLPALTAKLNDVTLLAGFAPLIVLQALHTAAWVYQNTLPWAWP